MRTKLLSLAAVVLAGTFLMAAAPAVEKAAIGQAAPAFTLNDQNGKAVNLADFAGKTVILEWINPACPFVVRHYDLKTMQNLAAKYKDKDVVWLAIDSSSKGSAADSKSWVEKYSLAYPILQDRDGTTGHAYGATSTPHMYIIDKTGKLAYSGAIDSQPDAKGELKSDTVNYVAKALDELLDGKTVSTPKTKAYGCSVKYAK